jgi:hypothetical protein
MAYFTRTRPAVWGVPRLLPTIYLVVGAVVAATHHYFASVDTARKGVSAVLAVVLWPLLLVGVDLHVRP